MKKISEANWDVVETLMGIDNDVWDDFGINSFKPQDYEVGGLRERVIEEIKNRIRPIIGGVGKEELDALEDENFHTCALAVEQLFNENGVTANKKASGEMQRENYIDYYIDYLEDMVDAVNEDDESTRFGVLQDMVRECYDWDSTLEGYLCEENDEYFFNTFFEGKPMEAVRAAFYGDYNPDDEYVHFNGYGNLESLSEYELKRSLEDGVDEILDAYLTMCDNGDVDTSVADSYIKDIDSED